MLRTFDKEGNEIEGSESKQNASTWRNLISNDYVAGVIVVCASISMAISGSSSFIGQVFGASNQFMASLAFLGISIYLTCLSK